MMFKLCLSFFFMLLVSIQILGNNQIKTLIHAGTVIDGYSNNLFKNMSLVIEDNKIVSIHKTFLDPKDYQHYINLKAYTVMPGLMDMHTHIDKQYHSKTQIERFTLETPDLAFRSIDYAKKTLLAGFTTIRNTGSDGKTVRALRDAIHQGLVVGPRIFQAGKAIATSGGHADPTNGVKQGLFPDPGPQEGVINGEKEAIKAVRLRYKKGSDLIKITATGGVLSVASSGDNAQFNMKELKAIVQTAQDYGLTVAAHAHGDLGIQRAALAGVDSIEHGTYMSKKTMQIMKKMGTYLVPTISAGKWVEEKSKQDGFFPKIVQKKAATIGPLIQNTFKNAYQMGVKIAFGTDCGVSSHGENAKEFVYMVEAGMPPMQAIQSATYHASKLLKINDRVGLIKAGLLADIIAVKGNPIEDISLLESVQFVMKDGKVYKNNAP